MIDGHVFGCGKAIVDLDAVEVVQSGDASAAPCVGDGGPNVRKDEFVATAALELVEQAEAGIAVAPAKDPGK